MLSGRNDNVSADLFNGRFKVTVPLKTYPGGEDEDSDDEDASDAGAEDDGVTIADCATRSAEEWTDDTVLTGFADQSVTNT